MTSTSNAIRPIPSLLQLLNNIRMVHSEEQNIQQINIYVIVTFETSTKLILITSNTCHSDSLPQSQPQVTTKESLHWTRGGGSTLSTLEILTDQRTKANDHGQDKVPRGCDDSRGEHLHFAVCARVSPRTDTLVLPWRLKVTAPSAILTGQPVALVHVHALHAALLETRPATGLRFIRRGVFERTWKVK